MFGLICQTLFWIGLTKNFDGQVAEGETYKNGEKEVLRSYYLTLGGLLEEKKFESTRIKKMYELNNILSLMKANILLYYIQGGPKILKIAKDETVQKAMLVIYTDNNFENDGLGKINGNFELETDYLVAKKLLTINTKMKTIEHNLDNKYWIAVFASSSTLVHFSLMREGLYVETNTINKHFQYDVRAFLQVRKNISEIKEIYQTDDKLNREVEIKDGRLQMTFPYFFLFYKMPCSKNQTCSQRISRIYKLFDFEIKIDSFNTYHKITPSKKGLLKFELIRGYQSALENHSYIIDYISNQNMFTVQPKEFKMAFAQSLKIWYNFEKSIIPNVTSQDSLWICIMISKIGIHFKKLFIFVGEDDAKRNQHLFPPSTNHYDEKINGKYIHSSYYRLESAEYASRDLNYEEEIILPLYSTGFYTNTESAIWINSKPRLKPLWWLYGVLWVTRWL